MKWNKKRSCLVLLSAVLCGMAVFLKPATNLKADDVKMTTAGLPQGESPSNRTNVGIDTPPKRLTLNNIFALPEKTDSFVKDNVVVITDEVGNQEGAIWSTPNNMMDLTQDFEFESTLFFGNKASGNGDGMTFAMHNDPERLGSKRGDSGQKLGVWGSLPSLNSKEFRTGALENSFIVEFDTYMNGNESDKNNMAGRAHVAYSFPWQNSSYSRISSGNLLTIHKHNGVQYYDTLATNEWTDFVMNWNAKDQLLTYKFGTSPAIVVPLDVSDVFGTTQVFWGFTGSTGGSMQHNRAAFTKIPGLVNAQSSAKITNAAGQSVEGKVIEGREVLTYEMQTTYQSGRQNWLDVKASITNNPYVNYLPGTLKVNDAIVDDATFFATKELGLGELSSASPIRKISFDVRTKDIEVAQSIDEVFSFHGSNYMTDLPKISYTIAKTDIKDNLTINPITPFNTSKEVSGEWQLSNVREFNSVQYQINNGSWVTLPQSAYGKNLDGTNKWSTVLPSSVLSGLDVNKQHTFRIKGIPNVLASGQTDVQASATFAIKPGLVTVKGPVRGTDTAITGTGTPGLTIQLKNEQGTVIKEAVVGVNGEYTLQPMALTEGMKLTVTQKSSYATSEPVEFVVTSGATAPILKVTAAGEKLTLTNGTGYDIKAQVIGSEVDNLIIKYALNGIVYEGLNVVKANSTANQVHDTTRTLAASVLPIGTHRITVSAEWQKTGLKVTAQDIEITVIAGGLKFIQVSAATSFEPGKINNSTQTLARQNDWKIQIEDSRGKGSQTKLYAKLTSNFKSKENHVIANPLKYINEQNQEVAMPVGSAVKVFEKEASENVVNVDVTWQKNQGILFDLKPGNYSGDYTGEIEWLLSDTP